MRRFAPVRRGYGMTELTLGMIILGILMVASVNFLVSSKEDYRQLNEIRTVNALHNGFKTAFDRISELVMTHCAEGYKDDDCRGTVPFPMFREENGMKYLFYSINVNGIDAIYNDGAATEIAGEIRGVFGNICKYDGTDDDASTGAKRVNFVCSWMEDLDLVDPADPETIILGDPEGNPTLGMYDTYANGVDPEKVPLVRVVYKRKYVSSTLEKDITYYLDLADVYDHRRAITIANFNSIEEALKGFNDAKMSAETTNVPPEGLNSNDDMLVPWLWQLLGNAPNTLCSRTGADYCDNLASDAVWKGDRVDASSPAPTAVNMDSEAVKTKLATNLGIGKEKFNDGFGNGVKIVLFAGRCGDTDLDNCPAVPGGGYVPPVPQPDYYKAYDAAGGEKPWMPPYTVVIYLEGHGDMTVPEKPYARKVIVF